jgi:hypothetical protein
LKPGREHGERRNKSQAPAAGDDELRHTTTLLPYPGVRQILRPG